MSAQTDAEPTESPTPDPIGGAVPAPVSDPTVRIRLDLAYDGSVFSGWARQPGLRTVEGCLEQAAGLVIREHVSFTVAGRTDAGVHAEHQVVHADLPAHFWARLTERETRGEADGVVPHKNAGDAAAGAALVRKLNGALGRVLERDGARVRPGARPVEAGAILIRQARRVPRAFDARFSALSRTYLYRIADGPAHQSPLTRWHSWSLREELDLDRLNEAAGRLLGLHDFLSFCKPRPGATTIRELQSLRFERTADGLITARVQADAFCHHMVRALVGACVQTASGQRDLEWLEERLSRPVRDSSIRMAPPEGLALHRVEYPEQKSAWAERAQVTRARRGQGDQDITAGERPAVD